MSNEIKQGDKVRVSKDIPMFYRRYNSYRVFEVEHQVVDIEDGIALLDSIPSKYVTTIPVKYLVKVDAEAKEAKFKVGDYVRYKGDVHKVVATTKDSRCYLNKILGSIDESDLKLYTEPTEQTEAEKKPNVGSIKIPVEVDLTDSYWEAYAAKLAKEVALKVANKYNDPKEAAEYAVLVAKAVVEGLKRK
jgi:hypothetical protein